uniref:Uncharacterized protein n=1 Tax=Cacopsylla melanoneura TaxID=428564 RepID=A0A8D8TEG0_9HEMI
MPPPHLPPPPQDCVPPLVLLMISAPRWLRLSTVPLHAVWPSMCVRSRLPTPLVVTQQLELALPYMAQDPPELELALPQLELAPPQLELAQPQLELVLPRLALAQLLFLSPTPLTSHAMLPLLDSNSSRPVPTARPSSFTLIPVLQMQHQWILPVLLKLPKRSFNYDFNLHFHQVPRVQQLLQLLTHLQLNLKIPLQLLPLQLILTLPQLELTPPQLELALLQLLSPVILAQPRLEMAPLQMELELAPLQLILALPQLELALPQLAQSLLRNPIPRMSHAIHHQLDSNRSRPVLAAILSSFTLLELAQGPLLLLLNIRCTPRGCPHVLRFTGPICV